MPKTVLKKDLKNKKFVIERTFDAPKQKVWPAYADKEFFEKWWGPQGWETTLKEHDLRPGGRVHYCMKCVDKNQDEWYGQESWGLMEVESVDEPNGFVYLDYFSDASGAKKDDMPGLKIEVELDEKDGKTVLRSICYAGSVEDIEKLVKMGMYEGFDSQLDKLEKLLQN